jgi:hypothetical protein
MSGRYTADAVALYHYLTDTLPDATDEVLAEAEAGVSIIEVPATTLAEVLYGVARTEEVKGIQLSVSPLDAQRGLLDEGPFELVETSADELAVFGSLADHLSLHDALVVASHRQRGTDAILTNDPEIAGVGEPTVWE